MKISEAERMRVAEVAARVAVDTDDLQHPGPRKMKIATAAGMRELKRLERAEPLRGGCTCPPEFWKALRTVLVIAIEAAVQAIRRV